MAQETLIYKLTWFTNNGRKLYKKWTHYDEMTNDTWANIKSNSINLAFIYLQQMEVVKLSLLKWIYKHITQVCTRSIKIE